MNLTQYTKHKSTGLYFKRDAVKPWKHQVEAIDYLIRQGFGALYTKPGSGKTRVFVDLIVNAGYKKVLIVAPKKPCQVWEPEFTKYALDGTYLTANLANMSGGSKAVWVKNNRNLHNKPLIVIVNYDSVWREPFKKEVLKTDWDAVICDESHRIKTPGAKVSRFLALLHDRVPHRFLCTGTPLHTKPTDIYGQYKFLDQSIFGTNFNNFKDRYENPDLAQSLKVGYPVLDRKKPYINLDELHEKMFSVAYAVNVDLHLPPCKQVEIPYVVSPKVTNLYKDLLKDHYIEYQDKELTLESILPLQLRQQQLLCGYLPLRDLNRKETLTIISKERMEVLIDLLDSLGDEPVVIFAKFRQDFKNLREYLHSNKKSFSEVSGAKDTYEDWAKGKTQYLLVQPQSGSEGLDMTRACYGIFYSKHRSLGIYNQSLARLDRPGQTRPVTYYHLIGKLKGHKSIDDIILASHALNMSIIQYIMSTGEI